MPPKDKPQKTLPNPAQKIVQNNKSYLTRKELLSLLGDEKNADLLEFTKDFFNLLDKSNPGKQTRDRTKDKRRLDAIARLMVGDETCAAFTFLHDELIIATNENNHEFDSILLRTNFFIQPGSSYKEGFRIIPCHQLIIASGTNQPYPLPIESKPVDYQYHAATDELVPAEKLVHISLEPSQHNIASLPFKIDYELGLSHIPKAASEFYASITAGTRHRLTHPYDFRATEEISIPVLFSMTEFNPLRRRISTTLRYLWIVFKIATEKMKLATTRKKLNWRQYQKRKKKSFLGAVDADSLIVGARQELLMQSLSWAVADWCKVNHEYRQYSPTSGKKEIDTFCKVLDKDWKEFIRFCENGTVKTPKDLWIESIKTKVSMGQIQVPLIITTKLGLEKFLERAVQYFIDLDTLAAYVSTLKRKTSEPLTQLLAHLVLYQERDVVKVIDYLEPGVHAEMRILWYLLHHFHSPYHYIAISKLCCAHCTLMINQHKMIAISGSHGKAYARWILPHELQQPLFLKTFLGHSLYEKFEKLKNEIVKLNNNRHNKGDLALLIIMSLPSLSQEDLRHFKIGDRLIWNDAKNELADNSDGEDEKETRHSMNVYEMKAISSLSNTRAPYSPLELPSTFSKVPSNIPPHGLNQHLLMAAKKPPSQETAKDENNHALQPNPF